LEILLELSLPQHDRENQEKQTNKGKDDPQSSEGRKGRIQIYPGPEMTEKKRQKLNQEKTKARKRNFEKPFLRIEEFTSRTRNIL
jgi:hypothetical protein